MYADELLLPWLAQVKAMIPVTRILDSHTHVGQRDPGGFTATSDELLESLDLAEGAALVFPMADPEGYAAANVACSELAARSSGRLTALVRVVPDDDPSGMLQRGLDSGARGLKLHPSSDEFEIEDRRLTDALTTADEQRLIVVVHGGPELDGVGRSALSLCRRFPGLRMVLAHCALTDLAWIWRDVANISNLFFDTSWWSPPQVMALFRLVPPGRILNASDLPYGTPVSATLTALRCAHQAGLDRRQLASVAGDQLARLAAGDEPLDLGPPPDRERRETGPLLDVIASTLLCAVEGMQRGQDPGDPLVIARHACKIPPDHPDGATAAAVRELLDLYDEHGPTLPHRNQFAPGRDLIAAAALVARTPSAPNP